MDLKEIVIYEWTTEEQIEKQLVKPKEPVYLAPIDDGTNKPVEYNYHPKGKDAQYGAWH
ncbi:MAG: hypothetical protein ACMXYL_04810 [Candidatus Woesearchaeota archaeon]